MHVQNNFTMTTYLIKFYFKIALNIWFNDKTIDLRPKNYKFELH